MSSLILEFAIVFLKELNIDFFPRLFYVNVVGRIASSFNDFSNRWCKWKKMLSLVP